MQSNVGNVCVGRTKGSAASSSPDGQHFTGPAPILPSLSGPVAVRLRDSQHILSTTETGSNHQQKHLQEGRRSHLLASSTVAGRQGSTWLESTRPPASRTRNPGRTSRRGHLGMEQFCWPLSDSRTRGWIQLPAPRVAPAGSSCCGPGAGPGSISGSSSSPVLVRVLILAWFCSQQ